MACILSQKISLVLRVGWFVITRYAWLYVSGLYGGTMHHPAVSFFCYYVAHVFGEKIRGAVRHGATAHDYGTFGEWREQSWLRWLLRCGLLQKTCQVGLILRRGRGREEIVLPPFHAAKSMCKSTTWSPVRLISLRLGSCSLNSDIRSNERPDLAVPPTPSERAFTFLVITRCRHICCRLGHRVTTPSS